MYRWRWDSKEISKFSVDRWNKVEGQTIYLTKSNAPLLIQNIFENTSLRITNTSTEIMLTKLHHLRSEVLRAVLLTVQVFWDMTPCHWAINSRVSNEQFFLMLRVTWPGTVSPDVYCSAKHTEQTKKQTTAGPTQKHMFKRQDNIKYIFKKHSDPKTFSLIQLNV